jgi:hypothetical protein
MLLYSLPLDLGPALYDVVSSLFQGSVCCNLEVVVNHRRAAMVASVELRTVNEVMTVMMIDDDGAGALNSYLSN